MERLESHILPMGLNKDKDLAFICLIATIKPI